VELSRSSTAEELASVLADLILSGRLVPDEPMREAALAEQYAVSRRTVREALTVLEQKGLVRHHRHRGARVTRLDAADIHDLYNVRRTLEQAAARAAARAGDERRRALTEALQRLSEATTLGRSEDIVACDLAFHRAVVGLLASPRIDAFFATIATEMRYALSILESSYRESKRRPKAALAEHRAIHDALLAADVRLAVRLIGEHVDVNETLLVAAVSADPGPAAR
jgi:DNA-binding GntR family transcriptional regulator